jgi:hypothetical protein
MQGILEERSAAAERRKSQRRGIATKERGMRMRETREQERPVMLQESVTGRKGATRVAIEIVARREAGRPSAIREAGSGGLESGRIGNMNGARRERTQHRVRWRKSGAGEIRGPLKGEGGRAVGV